MIQTGSLDLNAGTFSDPGVTGDVWSLHEGSGPRKFKTQDIPFSPPFATKPRVLLALAGLDADAQFNTRVTLKVEDVEPEEFNVVVSTWDDTLIYGVRVSWLAYDEA